MSTMLGAEHLIEITYLIATALFILSLRWMNSPVTARRGIYSGIAAMVLGVGGTLLSPSVDHFTAIAIEIGRAHV